MTAFREVWVTTRLVPEASRWSPRRPRPIHPSAATGRSPVPHRRPEAPRSPTEDGSSPTEHAPNPTFNDVIALDMKRQLDTSVRLHSGTTAIQLSADT